MMYGIEMTSATEFHQELLNAVGVCKACPPEDSEQAIAAMKILKAAKNNVALSLMGIKEAKADVKRFLEEHKKVKSLEDAGVTTTFSWALAPTVLFCFLWGRFWGRFMT